MWRIIYNIIITALFPFLILFGLTRKKMRMNLLERTRIPGTFLIPKDAIWIHAASVGEAIIAETLIGYWKKTRNAGNFLLTTNTYYTRDMLRRRYPDFSVTSLPFDLLWSVRRFLAAAAPSVLIIIETEIWPNLVWEAKKLGIPVIIVNGRISDKTLKTYQRFAFFFNSVLQSVDRVLTQSAEHARRFVSIGMDPKKVISTGNIKYYRDIEDSSFSQHPRDAITFGSIREKEVDAVVNVTGKLIDMPGKYTIFIAPREMHLVVPLEERLSRDFSTTRYSRYKDSGKSDADIVIVDTVGDLINVYGRSIVAFVGGSLAPYGGQNMLEPLFVKTPVIFGPYTENFPEIARNIIDNKAGIRIFSESELFEAIKLILENEKERHAMIENGTTVIRDQRQIMEKTLDSIDSVLIPDK